VLAERYKLVKLIGEGGMGSVYQAEHTTIGRKLAIKVLAPEFGDSPEVVARFLQEARTASMLHHEHIVDVTDFGYTKQGLAFLTMEYLEGENLADLLEREGRLPWTRVRRVILQICRALHAAHEKGIVHRDMKPDNCFRIKRGGNQDFIKILDFGIAKVISDGSLTGRQEKPKMATEAGTLLGTPEYMAPEIARDQKADARVDVYSLGILMYELLTGSVPFKGSTFMATVAMQMVDEPQPPSLSAAPRPASLRRSRRSSCSPSARTPTNASSRSANSPRRSSTPTRPCA
jgi:serine/threonine protein kinase